MVYFDDSLADDLAVFLLIVLEHEIDDDFLLVGFPRDRLVDFIYLV